MLYEDFLPVVAELLYPCKYYLRSQPYFQRKKSDGIGKHKPFLLSSLCSEVGRDHVNFAAFSIGHTFRASVAGLWGDFYIVESRIVILVWSLVSLRQEIRWGHHQLLCKGLTLVLDFCYRNSFSTLWVVKNEERKLFLQLSCTLSLMYWYR